MIRTRTARAPALVFLMILPAIHGCGDPSYESQTNAIDTIVSTVRSTVVPIDLCPSIPPSLAGRNGYRFDPEGAPEDAPGTLYLAPTNPRPGDEVFLFFMTRYGSAGGYSLTTTVRFTTNGWRDFNDATMSTLCMVEPPTQVYAVSLGIFNRETDLEFAVRYEAVSRDRAAVAGWLNNNRANYSIPIRQPRPLQWVGDSHIRQYEYYTPRDAVVEGHDLQVYTQTFPMGAAREVTLYWTDPAFSSIRSVPMVPDKDFVGSNRWNAQWRGVIEAANVVAGQPIIYWVRGDDYEGGIKWDSNDRRNYTATPKTFPVVWSGGLGSYRPATRGYRERELFNEDESTATGCYAPGTTSNYLARAIRIYIPGITDRETSDDGRLAAYARLIRAEVFAEAFPGTEAGVGALRFVRKLGNDFIYTFLEYDSYCNPITPLADAIYPYKIRISTDGGRSWFWRGTAMGGDGGDNLNARYFRDCNYLNLPDDCIDF